MNDIEVKVLVDKKIVMETLSRIGIANKKTKTLYPSCVLHNEDDKFYICHFKEMFTKTRENGYNNLSEEDIKRRNAIIFCLKNWGLIDCDDKLIEPHDIFVYVLKRTEKDQWNIQQKFKQFPII